MKVDKKSLNILMRMYDVLFRFGLAASGDWEYLDEYDTEHWEVRLI